MTSSNIICRTAGTTSASVVSIAAGDKLRVRLQHIRHLDRAREKLPTLTDSWAYGMVSLKICKLVQYAWVAKLC